jgi:GH25 family lysozyme M1 (1,4-beta-N-acetylmuramidase)
MTKFTEFAVRLVDVSYHQDDYDTTYVPVLDHLLAIGFMGIMVRVGWGLVIDRMFKTFWKAAKLIGLKRGGYWYLDYYSHKGKMNAEEWGAEQAEQCYEALKGDPGEMRLALDCEEFGGAWRISYLNRGDYQAVMRGFLKRWKELTGSYPIIYCSPGFIWVFEAWVKELDLWVAIYNRNISKERSVEYAREKGWKGRILFWQYTSDGDVDDNGTADGLEMGMETKTLDLDVWLGTLEEFSKYCGTTPPVVTPPVEDEPVPEDTGEWQTKVIRFMKVKSPDGLNIRAEGRYGSSWQAWMPNETIVPLLETVKRSGEIWHRIGYNQWCAELYNGTRFLI